MGTEGDGPCLLDILHQWRKCLAHIATSECSLAFIAAKYTNTDLVPFSDYKSELAVAIPCTAVLQMVLSRKDGITI